MSQSLPIRSMTGFARVRRRLGESEIVITLKSVNHRALDVHFHTGPEIDPFEAAIRALIKREVARGHIAVRISVDSGGGAGTLRLDPDRIAGYMAAYRQAADRFHLSGQPDLNAAFRIPGVLSDTAVQELPPEFEPELLAALEEALAALNAFRGREGAELATLLRKHNEAVYAAAAEIGEIRTRALDAFHSRLQERLSVLLANAVIDPQRLATEAAMLVDRSDIGEEVARLQIHSRQVGEILDRGGEAGKKLDFLLQEMNRETNTILSKTSGIGEAGLGITSLALVAKTDIEKMREQVLNLE